VCLRPRLCAFVLVCVPSSSFPGGRPRFWAVVFDRGPLGSRWWWRRCWPWALCFVCGHGVVDVVVVVVLVEERVSCHRL
jgi:hypothetical protein